MALPEPACRECGRARVLGLDTGLVHCPTPRCTAAGIATPLWRLLDTADIDHNPPGPHRPVHRGLPVPWIIPVVLGPDHQPMVLWRMIHRGRLAAAQRDWLCQHCGAPAATVVVDDSGRCLTPAPLHPDCATTSTTHCPHLTRTPAHTASITRGQEQRRGENAPEIGLTQDWQLPAGLY
ncbi:hypothetical protein ACTD5D_19410 [Nocardia takedensis]|uniref:hypothetical protein n=1 Tax=Nocardia takedensis TaxID=259390 RepID=UPI003F75824D